MSDSGASPSPFTSVNQMLIYNKCWLCERSFPKGLKKKVFQVSHVLDYCKTAYERNENPTFATNHMRKCYEFYVAFMDQEHAKLGVPRLAGTEVSPEANEALHKHLNQEDVEIWMSGLICCKNTECITDIGLFLPQAEQDRSTETGSIVSDTGVFVIQKKHENSDKDCPPGCTCDNPWPFLS
ncbi:hypothetical protein EON65_29245 [archaeon]|nr:MAG: hypothetical protein EON65_29245 [archaeon]